MKTAKLSEALSTAEVMVRLRARYADEGYAVLWEVGNSTGFKCNRWADALVMSLWPSRGLELHGFEIKVSRGDWKKELDQPQKAEAVCRFCDRWWVVAGHADIVKPEELPKTWGLILPDSDGLKIKKHAPELTPVPLDRNFVAAIFRRAAQQSVDDAFVKAKVADAKKLWEAEQKMQRDHEARLNADRGDPLSVLRKKVEEFEKFSGVKISEPYRDAKDIGKAVKMVLGNFGKPPWHFALQGMRHNVKSLVKALAEVEKEAKALSGGLSDDETEPEDGE